MSTKVDVCIVGAGIIGLATARALVEQRPGISIVVVDKEEEVASHQSGHSSGVIHSGLYYKPGSMKAKLAVEGSRQMYRFCEAEGVPYRRTGKIVVATRSSELSALEKLERRGSANGLNGLRRIGPEEIRELEPHAAGLAALHVPDAGVTDFQAVSRRIADKLEDSGVELSLGNAVTGVDRNSSGVTVTTTRSRVTSRIMINCAGLHSDRVARLDGVEESMRIIPFRGEYYRLDPDHADLVRALIYPVPDPRFPFLGVHFTRRISGEVEVGPNAILALGREHYRGSGANWGDVGEMLGFGGFRSLALRHFGSGIRELFNSRSTRQYARQARRLVPEVTEDHLTPGGAGVRAQAVDNRGRLIDDFVIVGTDTTIHVLNAPSPAATASLPIGRHIAVQVGARLDRT